MSWVRIWVHLVFSTRNREPLLGSKETRKKLFDHIVKNGKEKGFQIISIGGYNDHIHCLLSINDLNIGKVSQLIKGESSYWINKTKLIQHKFTWQDDYWAVSVSESHIQAVKEYIACQEEHHKQKTFSAEIDEFMKKYGWKFLDNID